MKSEKTNMDYLHEFIKDDDEAIEFWDAVKMEIAAKDKQILELEEHGRYLDAALEGFRELPSPELETIHLGIGIFEYVQPDNLKLQMIMDDLKDNPEKLLSI